jgi:hypothetical protein
MCLYVIQEQMTSDTPLDPVAPSVFIFVLYGMLTLYHQDDHFICEYIVFFWGGGGGCCAPMRVVAPPFLRFLDHTQ